DGALWIGTAGKGVFRLFNGTVTHFTAEKGFDEKSILTITEAADHSIWIGGMNCLARWQNGSFSKFNEIKMVRSIQAGPQNNLWIASKTGVFEWKNEKFSRIPVENDLLGVLRCAWPD